MKATKFPRICSPALNYYLSKEGKVPDWYQCMFLFFLSVIFRTGIFVYVNENLLAPFDGWHLNQPADSVIVIHPGISYKMTPIRSLYVDPFWTNVQKRCLTFQWHWPLTSPILNQLYQALWSTNCHQFDLSISILSGVLPQNHSKSISALSVSAVAWAKRHIWWKFHGNTASSLCVILLPNKQTNKRWTQANFVGKIIMVLLCKGDLCFGSLKASV